MTRRRGWFGLALLGLAATAAAYAVLVLTWAGQWVDAMAAAAIHEGVRAPLSGALSALARPLAIVGLAGVVMCLATWALIQRRWRAAAAAVLVPAVAVPVTYALRESVLGRPQLGVAGYQVNTFPSTHAAAAFSLTIAVLLLWPRRLERHDLLRPGLLVVLVGIGNVTSQAHRPADVLGALLLTATATALSVGVTGAPVGRWAET